MIWTIIKELKLQTRGKHVLSITEMYPNKCQYTNTHIILDCISEHYHCTEPYHFITALSKT